MKLAFVVQRYGADIAGGSEAHCRDLALRLSEPSATTGGAHSAHDVMLHTAALHELAHDADRRAEYIADAERFADRFKLAADQRAALIALDLPTIVKMGAHPLVPFLAQMQIQRLRPTK